MYASAMCVRLGAASQAAFEVIRQLWIVSIQLFECLNVATQSMAASLLGSGDRLGARALLARATLLSVGVGLLVGGGLLLLQRPLVAVFTSDVVVTQMCLGGCLILLGLLLSMGIWCGCCCSCRCVGPLSRWVLTSFSALHPPTPTPPHTPGIIPMIALLMPIDAGASIADGGFIAAGQTNTLSAIQVGD
jgi:Na+-driven multidrug efflux pump